MGVLGDIVSVIERSRERVSRLEVADSAGLIALPMHRHADLSAQPYTANQDPLIIVLPLDRAVRPIVSVLSYVIAPNTTSSYWTVSLLDSTGAVIGSVTTAPYSAATWNRQAMSLITPVVLPNTTAYLFLRIAKVGSPGGLYVSPLVLGRLTYGAMTLAPLLDTTAPTISGIVSTPADSSSVVTWTTNEIADSQVEYGLTTGYGASSSLDTNDVLSHSVMLSGLSASTLYHYRVKSRDPAGNLQTSADQTFTTDAATGLVFSQGGRTTDVAWEYIEPLSLPGDWYWGLVSGAHQVPIPVAKRALNIQTPSDITGLTHAFIASKFRAVVFDGEENNHATLLAQVIEVSDYIVDYNAAHPSAPLEYLLYMDLNAWDDIGASCFPLIDVMVFGHSQWQDDGDDLVNNTGHLATIQNLQVEAAPYIAMANAAGVPPAILCGYGAAYSGGVVLRTAAEVENNIRAVVEPAPRGCGVSRHHYYHGGDLATTLAAALIAVGRSSTGGLLTMAPTMRCTELPSWTYRPSDVAADPLFVSTSPVYAAMRDVIQPKIIRWLPKFAIGDSDTDSIQMTTGTVQTICQTIKAFGATIMVKGPTTNSHYRRDQWSDAALIAKYLALGDVIAAEFPDGFFWESVNELDMQYSQADAGRIPGEHWRYVFSQVRKQFIAAHPTCPVVWGGCALTNVGSPRYGDLTPYREPIDAWWVAVKAGWTAAPADEKYLHVPDFFSWHSYLCDATINQVGPLSELDGAVAFIGSCAQTFRTLADTAFPGAGIKLVLSEWNVDQSGLNLANWADRTAYAYPQVAQVCQDNGIWLAVQFLASGDSRTPAEAATGTPDMLDLQGQLINGGEAFTHFV